MLKNMKENKDIFIRGKDILQITPHAKVSLEG